MLIALAEDEDSKREKIKAFIRMAYTGAEILESRSVRGTTKAIRSGTLPDMLLLDMSLPTFDIAAGEPGGRPQGFGGIEVVRYLKRDDLTIPIIVITQHPAIPRDGELIDLSKIEEMVRSETPNNYKGLIYFDTLTGAWQSELKMMIDKILQERRDEDSAG